jgi:hypothetical protein
MDPNASGQGVLSAAAYAGRGFGEVSAAFGLEERYGDGLSLYEYLGSNGWGRFDAGGLFYAVEIGSIMKDITEAVAEQYAINMDTDFAWASDWSQSDEGFTRTSNSWVILSMSDAAFRNGLSYALGPLAFIKDAFDLGTDIGEYLFGSVDGDGDSFDDASPAVASSGGVVQKLAKSISKHGKRLHQFYIKVLMRRAMGFGHSLGRMRVNQQLIDPETGRVLSKKRPDVFAYSPGPPKTVFIGEAVVTTSKKEAVDRLRQFEQMYQRLGYITVTGIEP